jgi:predicted amidohydrolase
MKSLQIAAVQLRARDRSQFIQAWPAIEARIEEAASGADLVVVPECTIPGYVVGNEPFTHVEEEAISSAVGSLRRIAEKHRVTIVAGAVVRDQSTMRNSALVIDRDGTIAGRADKAFLWHFDRRWFTAGSCIEPVETLSGRLGVLVCADGRMPEIARTLVDKGAQLLVMPTAWVSSGRDPQNLENFIADVLGRVRALENGVPFVGANKCGSEQDMVLYCGKSQLIDDCGNVIASASERDEEIVRASVTVGTAHPCRVSLPDPSPRKPSAEGTFRVALTARTAPADIEKRLEILGCEYLITPEVDDTRAKLDARAAVAFVGDAEVLDPGTLPGYRRAGYRVAIWTHRKPFDPMLLARARAGECRMYVAVLDLVATRAFIVDPDAVVIAGTLDDYRIASCAVDLAKTSQATVVPGTDVLEGFARMAELTRERSTA